MNPPDLPPPSFREKYVLLWSAKQECFHCETVEEMLRENRAAFFYHSYHDSDWVVVGFADTREAALEMRESMTQAFDKPMEGEPYVPPPDLS